MAELECPACKSDSYLNPGIKILISPCFHKLCEQCVYRIFAKGVAPCPTCQTPLRRINFIASTFEDIEVGREVGIRRMLLRYFDHSREEFPSLDAYNDYLEAFEDVVFELLELESEAAVKKRIAALREAPGMLRPAVRLEDGEAAAGEVKRVHVKEAAWTVAPVGEPRWEGALSGVPAVLLVPCEASGFSLRLVNDMLVSSVYARGC